MNTFTTLRIENDAAVRSLVLCRPEQFNTITAALRDELSQALDAADRDATVKVILLRAEGRAFCAGFGLDWSTFEQAEAGQSSGPVWDSVADLSLIGSFAAVFSKLHSCSKPTLAAVQGWCVAGGTDLALNSDLIICADSARFGYPPARVWGVPEQPWLWVARLGLQAARRYLFTGDEIDAKEAERLGLVWARVADDALQAEAMQLAQRIARMPLNQLQMMKLLLNDTANRAYDPSTSRLLGCLFDGVARHTQEGVDFVARAKEAGWRQAVRERDAPFGDYGERKPT
jgi:enoyl-CoA hydratase